MSGEGSGLLPWQVDASGVAEESWDAVVVGGGPSGSMAALHLASGGWRVLLVERHVYPRDKACGDLLIPDSIAALRRAGLYDAVAGIARPLEEAVISSPSRIAWSIPGEYLCLQREKLDALLAQSAADRGATVAHGRVEAVRARDDGSVEVDVRGRERPFLGRTAVLAAGADVSLIAALGMVERAAPTAVAVRAYVRSPLTVASMLISFDREIVPGYAWIFPLPDQVYNVGVGTLHDPDDPARHDLRALYDTFCREVPEAKALTGAAEWSSPIRGARLRCGLSGARARGPGNVVAVGEQIGTTYPFTGEGIGKAMETGELAAEHVGAFLGGDAEALDRYAVRVEHDLRPRYRGYEVAQQWLARPWLNDLLSWRMRRGRWLQEAARGVVAETVDPADVFSWKGLLRSVVG